MAHHAGLSADLVQGLRYQHQLFVGHSDTGDSLFVFIDGDGSPWSADGRRINRDPTPRRPLALELAAQTPRSILYLGRPCYFSARFDSACNPRVWTSERYSRPVVDSLAAAVNHYVSDHGYSHVALIGYSGGGTLAVLMAPQVRSTVAVITIAANLDVDAWARGHRYLPLEGSLNPAAEPPLDAAIRQWHLLGDRDANVPEELSRRYLDNINPDDIWRYAGFDHVCCWAEQWPAILTRIEHALGD